MNGGNDFCFVKKIQLLLFPMLRCTCTTLYNILNNWYVNTLLKTTVKKKSAKSHVKDNIDRTRWLDWTELLRCYVAYVFISFSDWILF